MSTARRLTDVSYGPLEDDAGDERTLADILAESSENDASDTARANRSPAQVESDYLQTLVEEGLRRPKVKYGLGRLPATTFRANVGGTNGALDITSNDGVLQLTGEPGIMVVLGSPAGYEMAELGASANPIYFPLTTGACFRNQLGLSYMAIGTPAYDLVIGWFPVDHETDENYAKATAQAKAFAGYPIPLTDTQAAPVTTTAAIIGKAYDGSGPAAYDAKAVPGTGPRTVQIGLDTNTPPGLNDPLMVFCLASTAALSKASTGVMMVPGGTFLWPGGPAFITEVAIIAGAPNSYSTVTYSS